MTVTIIVAVICLIAGGVASYLFFRYGLKNKYNTILKEAEAEAEVSKIKAQAEAEVILIAAEAEAEAK